MNVAHLPVEDNVITDPLIQKRLENPKEDVENSEFIHHFNWDKYEEPYLGWFIIWKLLNQSGTDPFKMAAKDFIWFIPRYLEMCHIIHCSSSGQYT